MGSKRGERGRRKVKSERDVKRRKNEENKFNTYTLFDGLAYNTCGYFASCVVFFRAPQGRGKIRAMSKMSARIIC